MLFLGVGATAIAYLLYFGLIAGAGASRAILVTYLVPSLALVYGAVFLDETDHGARARRARARARRGRARHRVRVRRGEPLLAELLLLLAAVWGASYLFIKVAVEEIEPAADDGRADAPAPRPCCSATSSGGSARTRAPAELRAAWRHCLVLGVLNAAAPVLADRVGREAHRLGARGRRAGVGADLQRAARAPLPAARAAEPRRGRSGSRSGIVGVGVVTGIHPERRLAGRRRRARGRRSPRSRTRAQASTGSARSRARAGPVLAAGSMLVGGLILLPFALFQLPAQVPSWEAIASVLALALLGTALAQLSSSACSRCTARRGSRSSPT